MNTKRSKWASVTPEAHGEYLSPRSLEESETSASGKNRDAALADDVKETARTAGIALQEQASSFAADIGHELSKTAEDQKSRGVEAIRAFATAVNNAAGELEQQSPRVARYVRDAAESVQSLSGNIENRDISELLRNASDYARNRPAMFFAGAMAAGFAFSRFLKSSAQRAEIPQGETGSDQPNVSSEH